MVFIVPALSRLPLLTKDAHPGGGRVRECLMEEELLFAASHWISGYGQARDL
jgi:hypothetical protein